MAINPFQNLARGIANATDSAINDAVGAIKKVFIESNRPANPINNRNANYYGISGSLVKHMLNPNYQAMKRAAYSDGAKVSGTRMNQYMNDTKKYMNLRRGGYNTMLDDAAQLGRSLRSNLYNTETGNYSPTRIAIAGANGIGLTMTGIGIMGDD